MLHTLLGCVQTLTMIFACVGGIFGALTAKKRGAPGPAPVIVAVGFGIYLAVAAWFGLFEVIPQDILEWGLFRRATVMLGMLTELLCLGLLIVGVALLRAPAKPAEAP